MNGVSSLRLWMMMIALMLGLPLAACSEKPAAQPTYGTNAPADGKDSDGDGDDDDGDDDDGDGDGDGGSTSSFKLCDALQDENDLEKWSDYVEELCGSDAKLEILRNSDNVYTGGSETTVQMGPSDENGDEVSFRLFSSSRVPTTAAKYYQMLQLQFFEPEEFDKKFTRDEFVEKYEVIDSSSTSVEYEYLNTKESASAVHYIAKSFFIQLKEGQAYVVATELLESKETMVDLKGLIIVNKASSSKAEVFVVSDQTYDKGNQDTSVARANARESLEDEQKRSYKNAETADSEF